MNIPNKLSLARARLWLSEATGQALPAGSKVAYLKPYIHVWTPAFPKIVERYDVANIYGECDDDIPLKDSPLAAKVTP